MNNKRYFLTTIAMSIFLAMTFIDEAGVGVTLIAMQDELRLSDFYVQWIMNSFFLVLTICVLPAGVLADRIGARNIFAIGMIIFLVASVLCAIAHSGWMLVSARGLQGLGVAMAMASYVLLVHRVFPRDEIGKALGTCAAVAAIFLILAPLIGGFFTHYLSWRWLFWINIPLSLVALVATHNAVPKDVNTNNHSAHFDYTGLVLFVIALIFISSIGSIDALPFDTGQAFSVAMVFGIVIVGFFIAHHYFKRDAFVDFRLFKDSDFRGANIVLLLVQVAVFSITFWSIWLQKSLNMSPLQAGLCLLPAGLPIVVMARLGGIWFDKHGAKLPLSLGSGLMCISVAWLALTAEQNSYTLAFIGFLGYGISAPLIIAPAINHVLINTPEHKQGMGSGISNTLRQLGGVICFSLVAAVMNHVYLGAKLTINDADAYSQSFASGMWVVAILLLISFIVSITHFSHRTQKFEAVTQD